MFHKNNRKSMSTVADPDFELRWGPGFGLLALPAILPSFISSFFTQNGGGGGRPWAPPLDPPLVKNIEWRDFNSSNSNILSCRNNKTIKSNAGNSRATQGCCVLRGKFHHQYQLVLIFNRNNKQQTCKRIKRILTLQTTTIVHF